VDATEVVDAAAPAPQAWSPVALAAWVTTLIGALAVARIGLEIHHVGGAQAGNGDLVIIGVEAVLALLALIAGAGLLKHRPWALPVAALAGSAAFVDAVGALVILGPNLFRLLMILGMNQDLPIWSAVGSRLVMTSIQALWWPVLFGLLHLHLPINRRRFWSLALAGAVLSLMVQVLARRP
jgi:hypothetical protein